MSLKLTKIELKNFQKHEHLVITIPENNSVTTITGSSKRGKSCILRAIRWVFCNDLAPTTIRRTITENGEIKMTKETAVLISLSDSSVIKKVLSNTKNEYYLNDKKITGFGRNVPDEIREKLNLTEMNFQWQFDSPFMIGESGGSSIAKELNSIASLEEMDIVTDAVNKDIRETSAKLKETEEKLHREESFIESIQKDYSNLGNALDIEKLYSEYEKYIKDSEEIKSVTKHLTDLNNIYKKIDLKKISKISDELKNIELSNQEDREDKYSELKKLFEFLEEHKPITVNVQKLTNNLDELKSLIDNLSKFNSKQNNLSKLNKLMIENAQAIKSSKETLKGLQSEIDTYKTCPTCGTPLKECKE